MYGEVGAGCGEWEEGKEGEEGLGEEEDGGDGGESSNGDWPFDVRSLGRSSCPASSVNSPKTFPLKFNQLPFDAHLKQKYTPVSLCTFSLYRLL